MAEKYVMIIDTGTTNSRVLLLDSARNIAAKVECETGVKDTAIDGNNSRLKAAVKRCLEDALKEAKIGYGQIERIIASGMITSNVGLIEVPHLTAPAGKEDLAKGIHRELLPDVAPIPIDFVPGVKNAVNAVNFENFDQMDIMRGEEVETIAVINSMDRFESLLVVLPGSHTKFVSVNEKGKITGCLTTITGELLSCVTRNTIIADVVGRKFVSEATYNEEMVLLGYMQAQVCGIGRACFSGRILNQFAEKDTDKMANYILGAVLQNDILALQQSKAISVTKNTRVVVAGKNPLRKAVAAILRKDGYFTDIIEFKNSGSLPISAEGALLVTDMCRGTEMI